MKEREFLLLDAIAEDETVTQSGLAAHLGIAIGSVNWYIKRLIGRGYLKATRMDRTRLRYNLTPEGMAVWTKNATQYVKDSLSVYRDLREQARELVFTLQEKGGQSVYLPEDGEVMDILRLTCIEMEIELDDEPREWRVKFKNGRYHLAEQPEGAAAGGRHD